MWMKNVNVLQVSLNFCGYFFKDKITKAAKFYSYCITLHHIITYLAIYLLYNTMFYIHIVRHMNRLIATLEFLLAILCNSSNTFYLLVLQTKTNEIGRLDNKLNS